MDSSDLGARVGEETVTSGCPSELCPRCGKTLTLRTEMETGDSYWLCQTGLGGCGREFGLVVGKVRGIDWDVDPGVPPNEIELRIGDRTVGRIVNIKPEGKS